MGVSILIYRIFTLPTPDTLAYLEQHFSATNLEIDWDSLCVELGSSSTPVDLAPIETSYSVVPGSMGSWYDAATARSWLILPLFASPKMARRAVAIGNVWDRPFMSYMTLTDKHNNRHKTKARINSIATALVDLSPILKFHGEVSVESPNIPPPHEEFYNDWRGKGGLSNQVFLEEDEGVE